MEIIEIFPANSGIICGLDVDSQLLEKKCHRSQDSFDSGGGVDVDEECSEASNNRTMNDGTATPPTDLDENEVDPLGENVVTATVNDEITIHEAVNLDVDIPCPSQDTSTKVDTNSKHKSDTESKQDNAKNEVIFKSIFGATKNAIFRTAQSIIENHEKKNAAKQVKGGSSEEISIKSPDVSKRKDFFSLKPSSSRNKIAALSSPDSQTEDDARPMTKSASSLSLTLCDSNLKLPGTVKCFTKQREVESLQPRPERGHNGLLRFFESSVFNIHFAIHYLYYSKEPGVLTFIGNKLFSFKDNDVDLYIPQLILMYIQMDELAEVLDMYLIYRCRRSADFSLKVLWLMEAFNYNAELMSYEKTHLSLLKELYPKKHRRHLRNTESFRENSIASPIKKTHHR